jgi:hypothetical protein
MKFEKLNWPAMATLLLLSFSLTAAAQTTTFQAADLHNFNPPNEALAGAGTMIRSADEVWVTLSASGLDKKAAYTGWWIVFNNPDECFDGPGHCGPQDLDDRPPGDGINVAGSSIFYALGFTTGTDGAVNVSTHVTAGETAVGKEKFWGDGLAAGNGFDAEMHLLFRSHWKTIPGEAASQISEYGGACGASSHGCSDQVAFQFNANPLP